MFKKAFELEELVPIDIETEPITELVPYPKPIGINVWIEGKPQYITENIKEFLIGLEVDAGILDYYFAGHNISFDYMCIKVHYGVDLFKFPYHDTVVLSWLVNPELNPTYEELQLKWLTAKWCKMPPDEQSDMHQWLYENQHTFAHKYEGQRNKKGHLFFHRNESAEKKSDTDEKLFKRQARDWSQWGAFICEAPVELVAPYAISDGLRAYKLLDYIATSTHLGKIDNNSDALWETYQRELKLSEILAHRTEQGFRMDVQALESDRDQIEKWLEPLWKHISEYLKISAISQKQLIKSLIVNFGVSPRAFKVFTDKQSYPNDDVLKQFKKRVPSPSVDALEQAWDDPILQDMRLYLRLKKFKSTYIDNWLRKTQNGRMKMGFFTLLNTGRISASNLANIPKRAGKEQIQCDPKFRHMTIPQVRKYILPDEEGHTIISSDFKSQEIRQLAHFLPTNSTLPKMFIDDPDVDAHQRTVEIFKDKFNIDMLRSDSKDINFGIVYGLQDPGLAAKMGRSVQQASTFRRLYLNIFYGIEALTEKIAKRLRAGSYITTVGKRKFFLRDKRVYKYINYLIQGSSADQTKAAIVKYMAHPDRKGTVMFPLHDEIAFSVENKYVESELLIITECMEHCGIELTVPFRVDIDVKEFNYDK